MENIDELLATIAANVQRIRASIEIERGEMIKLQEAGLIYAGTWYKNKKYLYLVHPDRDGQGRQREYIGADEAKVNEALAGIERAKKYDKCAARKEWLERQLGSVAYQLRQARFASIGDK